MAIRASAVINLKKLAGGPAANVAEICKHVRLCENLIKRQIAILDPHVVVCAGTVDFANLLMPNLQLGRYSFGRLDGRIWISTMHPSARRGNSTMYETVVELYKQAQTAE